MDPSYLSQHLMSLSSCNLGALKHIRSKFQQQTEELLANYQKVKTENENHKKLELDYEELLKQSQQSIDQNQKIQNEVNQRENNIERLEALKEEKKRMLGMKRQKQQELRQRQSEVIQSQWKSQQIEYQNQQLASRLFRQKQSCNQLLRSRKQLKSLIDLVKNQKLTIQLQRQRVENQYRRRSIEREDLWTEIGDELEIVKKEIMEMKYQLLKGGEYRTKKNKVQLLGEIRQMIQKHREDMNKSI